MSKTHLHRRCEMPLGIVLRMYVAELLLFHGCFVSL